MNNKIINKIIETTYKIEMENAIYITVGIYFIFIKKKVNYLVK